MNFNDNNNLQSSNKNTDGINEVITELTTYFPYNISETTQTTKLTEPTTQELTTIQGQTTELTTNITKSEAHVLNKPTIPTPEPATQVSNNPTNNAAPTQNKTTVKITKTGKKYHKSTCQYVKGKDNTTELTIEDALKKGFTPCSKCKPQ